MLMPKQFRLSKDQIKLIVSGYGGCMATDRIVIDGTPIGYMYREDPVNPQDSGWRFFAGDEDDEYMRDTTRHGVYAVNTIVNYDPSVLPYLDAAFGTRLERTANGMFEAVTD